MDGVQRNFPVVNGTNLPVSGQTRDESCMSAFFRSVRQLVCCQRYLPEADRTALLRLSILHLKDASPQTLVYGEENISLQATHETHSLAGDGFSDGQIQEHRLRSEKISDVISQYVSKNKGLSEAEIEKIFDRADKLGMKTQFVDDITFDKVFCPGWRVQSDNNYTEL